MLRRVCTFSSRIDNACKYMKTRISKFRRQSHCIAAIISFKKNSICGAYHFWNSSGKRDDILRYVAVVYSDDACFVVQILT